MALGRPALTTLLICGPYMNPIHTQTHTHMHTTEAPPKTLMSSVVFPQRFDGETEGITWRVICKNFPGILLSPPSAPSPDLLSLRSSFISPLLTFIYIQTSLLTAPFSPTDLQSLSHTNLSKSALLPHAARPKGVKEKTIPRARYMTLRPAEGSVLAFAGAP